MAPAKLSIEERAAKAGPPPTWGADSHKKFEPPMEYFLNFPRHAPALFSTNNGSRPRRSLDQFIGPRAIFPWNASQIIAAVTTLRKYCFPLFKYIQKPVSYTDLYNYWDAYDLWHMGAYNLWNVLNYLYRETQKEMPALIAETRACIEEWAGTLLQNPACRSKLMAWDPDTDDSPLSVFDGEELVDLDGMENFWIPLVEDVLKLAQHDLLRNKYVTPALTRQPKTPCPKTGFEKSHGYCGTVWSFRTSSAGPATPLVFGESSHPSALSKTGQPTKNRTNTKPTKEICVLDGTSATAAKKALASMNAVAPSVATEWTGPSVKQPPSTSLHSIQEIDETDKPRRASLEPPKDHQSSLIPPPTSSRNSSAPTPSPMPDQPASVPSMTGSQEVRAFPGNQPPTGEKPVVRGLTAQTIHSAPGTQVLREEPPCTPKYHLPLQPYGQPNMSHYPRLEPGRWPQVPYLPAPFQFPIPGTIPPSSQQLQSHDGVSDETRGSTKPFTPTCPMPPGPRGNMHAQDSSPRAANETLQKGSNQDSILPAHSLPWSGPHFRPLMQGQTFGSWPSSQPTLMDNRRVSALPMGSNVPPHVSRTCEPVFYHNPKGHKNHHDQTVQSGNAKDYMHTPQHRNANTALDNRGGIDRCASNSRHEPQVGNLLTHGKDLSPQGAHPPSNRDRGDTVSSSRSIPQDPACLNRARWLSPVDRGSVTYDPCPCQFCKAKDRSIYLASFSRREIETKGAQQRIWSEFSKYGNIEKMYLCPKREKYTFTIRYREQASVFHALKDGDRRFFDFCDHHTIRVSHPWGSQFYVPPQTSSHMPAQPGTLYQQSLRSVSKQSDPQAGSPLAAHSIAAPGVDDVLEHMENGAKRRVSPQLHGSHGQVAVRLQSAELSPGDFDVARRDTASMETRASEESSDVLLTKIQELVSTRSSRAGSLSQNDQQGVPGRAPSLPTQEQYNSGDNKEIDHGTVIHRPNKGKHAALPICWHQQAGSDANESTSVTRNTSSRSLMVDCTSSPSSPQKSKSAKSRNQGKKKAPLEQPKTSTLPVRTNEDYVVEGKMSPWDDQKRADRPTLNPMGFDLHGSPQRGSLTRPRGFSSFMKHSLASGPTKTRPGHDQQMREPRQCPAGSKPGQQYGSLAVKKQRGLQAHECQPSVTSSSSQRPSYSASPEDHGPPLGYSTLGLPYPSPPKTSAIPGSCQPWVGLRPFAEQDDREDRYNSGGGSAHESHRENSIPFPPYVEPTSVQPSAVVSLIPPYKPARKQGEKNKMLNPEAKEFVAPTSVSSDPNSASGHPEAPSASPRESNVLDLPFSQPTSSPALVKDDASDASSRTMAVDDDVVKEQYCRAVEIPPVAEQTNSNTLDEGKGPEVSEEPLVESTGETRPILAASQPKDSEKRVQQPVEKTPLGSQDAAPEGSKRKEAKQGKQWPKNKQYKKGHTRQESRGDINQSWRKVDEKSNEDSTVRASEISDVRDTASATPSTAGGRGGGSDKDQGQHHLAAVAGSKEQSCLSCEEEISTHKEKTSTKDTEETAEKAVVSAEHDLSTGSELKVEMPNPTQNTTVQSDAPEQRDTARDAQCADTRYSSGPEKRNWPVAVPLIVPGKTGKPVDSSKTKPRVSSKAETSEVPESEGNAQNEPNQKVTGQELSKKGDTPKKQKKPTVDNKEEPSSLQAQPPRYVPGANWVEELKDNKKNKKPKAAHSIDKNPSAPEDGGSPAKKDSAPAPSGPTAQSATARTEPQVSEEGQVITSQAGDSTSSSTPAPVITNYTLCQKDDGRRRTEAQAEDTTGSRTARSSAGSLSIPPVPTTQPTKAQKNKKKKNKAARKKAQAENAPTTEPAAEPTDTSRPADQSAPAPVASSGPKDGPEPPAPAPKVTPSPQKPGRPAKQAKGKDDGGSPETLLEGEERKGG